MARSEITGKRRLRARNVSHSNIKTPRWQQVNVQKRRLFIPELGRYVTLKLTTKDLRTIDKIGLMAYAKKLNAKAS
ncbi:MAG: 50S ribosomal protein L28 [Myxococcales bacterium]|nr:50S ribosomal protein L28 [Myxococcales bacterium]